MKWGRKDLFHSINKKKTRHKQEIAISILKNENYET